MSQGEIAATSMVNRVAEILETFHGRSGLTLAQVVSRSGLPRSSVHRILEQLVAVQWLTREDNVYRMGVRMLELGGLAVRQDALHAAALPYMYDLNMTSRFVVHLAVLSGTDIVYLEKIGGRFAVDLPSRVGSRAPAYCTAVGKALLAFGGDDLVREVVDAGLKARTRFTITNRADFERELRRVRERGAAFEREECLPGIGCVAAPVRGAGAPVGAISLCGPVRGVNFGQLAPSVQQAAQHIWRALEKRRPREYEADEQQDAARSPAMLDEWVSWPHLGGWL
jgi:DNA-binding IclR family transcriptional regulator